MLLLREDANTRLAENWVLRAGRVRWGGGFMTGHDAAEDQCPGVAGPRHGALSIMALELQEKGWVPLLGNGDIGARRKDKNKKKKLTPLRAVSELDMISFKNIRKCDIPFILCIVIKILQNKNIVK